ncbi:hypothetical protein [Paraburkholderia sejongensis]|nr:hypothetical protein [Paraburkholderia sp. MMS20-SJTR3]
MKKLADYMGSERGHNQIVKGGGIAIVLISIGLLALLLPGIFNR